MPTTFKPVISTAKVRGIIKKNDIWYVDATRRLYGSTSGLSVWQLGNSVYVRAFGPEWESDTAILRNALNEMGLTLETTHHNEDTFIIVKAVA